MTRRTLLALPLAQPLAATVPPLSPLEESKLAILGLTFEDRAELFRWWFGATARPPLSVDELKDGIIGLNFADRIALLQWFDTEGWKGSRRSRLGTLKDKTWGINPDWWNAFYDRQY